MTGPHNQMQVEVIAVRRTVIPSAYQAQSVTPRMTIQSDNGVGPLIRIPFAPQEVSHDEYGADWVTVDRPLTTPLILMAGKKLNQMSFELIVADKMVTSSNGVTTVDTAETVIQQLKDYAEAGTRLRVVYGTWESALWYLVDFNFKSVRRAYLNQITQATVSLTFRRASDAQAGVGPITGGVRPPQTSPPPPPPPQQTGARYYVVKAGDTLWAISIKFYGTGTKWTTIANTNGIKDPRKLQIGTRLRIP